MSYTAHRDLLTVPVWSPLHRKVWYITPHQYQLMCRILSGRRFTLRTLAAEIGYSVGGLHDALQALVTGGLVAVQTRLGCKGWTFAKGKPGVVALRAAAAIRDVLTNVRSLGTSSSKTSSENVSPIANIPNQAPPGESFAEKMARYGYRP